jgi:hypothetical protein
MWLLTIDDKEKSTFSHWGVIIIGTDKRKTIFEAIAAVPY